jgi:hypothetical protein
MKQAALYAANEQAMLLMDAARLDSAPHAALPRALVNAHHDRNQ